MNSTTRITMAALTLALSASLAACSDGHLGGGEGGGAGLPPSGKACSPNDAIMKGLAPTCAGCHTQGATPFFASLSTFEALIAYNDKYVVPGHPEQSYLIKLLQGAGAGTYKQMPLSGDSFVKMEDAGMTAITLAQIEGWITQLTPRAKVTTPAPGAVTVQRISAQQIRSTLYAQLGLSRDDFFTQLPDSAYGVLQTKGEDNYPLRNGDEVPVSNEREPVTRYNSLGGSWTLDGRKLDLAASSPFAQALVGVSQRWCNMGIAKPDSKLLFPHVDKAAKSATAADDIRKNIGYLSVHFHGKSASAEDVENVFQNVFLPLEAESDSPTAWAGVCSYFIRHPGWIFY
jgi:hypothetical protein